MVQASDLGPAAVTAMVQASDLGPAAVTAMVQASDLGPAAVTALVDTQTPRKVYLVNFRKRLQLPDLSVITTVGPPQGSDARVDLTNQLPSVPITDDQHLQLVLNEAIEHVRRIHVTDQYDAKPTRPFLVPLPDGNAALVVTHHGYDPASWFYPKLFLNVQGQPTKKWDRVSYHLTLFEALVSSHHQSQGRLYHRLDPHSAQVLLYTNHYIAKHLEDIKEQNDAGHILCIDKPHKLIPTFAHWHMPELYDSVQNAFHKIKTLFKYVSILSRRANGTREPPRPILQRRSPR
jgi:hypothetical protein